MSAVVRVKPNIPMGRAIIVDDWERIGRQHFLNRQAFAEPRQPPQTGEHPMASIIALLLFAFAWVHAFRKVSAWMLPEITPVFNWLFSQLWRHSNSLCRRVFDLLWHRPCRYLGVLTTLLLWGVVSGVMATVSAIANLDIRLAPAIVGLWLCLYFAWGLCRWWRNRRYRVHVLPQRRRWR